MPTLQLAFEYQGEVHYRSTSTYGSASRRQLSDQLKKQYAIEEGVTLIPIPFWWDKSPASLAATIKSYRPDVHVPSTTGQASPIPPEMPTNALRVIPYIPNVSQVFDEDKDPTGLY
jgi:hypothetical protein